MHDPLKKAKGSETRAVAARGWDGGLQEAQGNFEGDGNNLHLDYESGFMIENIGQNSVLCT